MDEHAGRTTGPGTRIWSIDPEVSGEVRSGWMIRCCVPLSHCEGCTRISFERIGDDLFNCSLTGLKGCSLCLGLAWVAHFKLALNFHFRMGCRPLRGFPDVSAAYAHTYALIHRVTRLPLACSFVTLFLLSWIPLVSGYPRGICRARCPSRVPRTELN